MIHPSRNSPIAETQHDSWDWWNDFRIHCDYDKRVGVVLELPDIRHVPPSDDIDRWVRLLFN